MKIKSSFSQNLLCRGAMKPVLGGLALAALTLASPLANAQVVTSGLVANYSVDSLSGSTVSAWGNSVTGSGAFADANIQGTQTSAAIVTSLSPGAGKYVDLSAGDSGFKTIVNGTPQGTYGSYTGMTFFVVARITATDFFGGVAGPYEQNSIRQGPLTDSIQGLADNSVVTPDISNVVGNWAVYAMTLTNNTSGTNTVIDIYRTNYTAGTPTTDHTSATALSTSGTFTLTGVSDRDYFAFGTGIQQNGFNNLDSNIDISAVLVYNNVLSSGDIAQTTGALYSQYFAVPEPGTVVLSGLGGMLLLFGRKMRGGWRRGDRKDA